MEFWSQLSEDVPDLGKLTDLGHKINALNALIDEHWERLEKINSDVPAMQRLYGR